MAGYSLTVNGRRHTVDAEAEMPLLWVLRDLLALTGTRFGCGEGVCGACTIHENGAALRSCLLPISAAAGRSFVTIEGLSPDGSHPCQRAWIEQDVSQCGYCQPGMIMTAAALLRETPAPTDAQIDATMAGTVCRCGTFSRIKRAIRRAAELGAKR